MTWFHKKRRPFISNPTHYSSFSESRESPSPEANADGKATAENAQEPGGWFLGTQWSHWQLQTIHSGGFLTWENKLPSPLFWTSLFRVVKLNPLVTFTNIISYFKIVPLTEYCNFLLEKWDNSFFLVFEWVNSWTFSIWYFALNSGGFLHI